MINEVEQMSSNDEMFVDEGVVSNIEQAVEEPKKENIFLGILGALLGSVVGAVLIVVLGQLGYIASISGLVMGYIALRLYKKFAGSISIVGLVITIIIMLVMVYVGDRIEWALILADSIGDAEYTLFDYYSIIPVLLKEGYLSMADYIKDLGMLYLFTLLGIVPAIKKYGINN